MATVSRGTTPEKYRFIARNRKYGVKHLCKRLGVSRSGYYAWLNREPSKRFKEDQRLLREIRNIYKNSREIYGSPRVYRTLKARGRRVGKKRVERLMRSARLRARVMRVTRRQPRLKIFKAAGPNLRLKASEVTGLNQQWVADITYLKVGRRWWYLAVVLDVFSRRVVGWSLSWKRNTDLTVRALRNALKSRSPADGLIFHTDRGIEYTALDFSEVLKEKGLRASFNRPGYCTDNAHVESFFHSLKTELIRGRRYSTAMDLRSSLNSYINQFYNKRRMHSGIDYNSPAQFERTIEA